ncbi:BolA family protein [Roseisalinus antarcticus]|uniref:Transcriptional regulator BolA n=1 Tax=Roseisalinus antarcticus TaxID=254357 RepID=A0A1Y5SI62_9RHOB|nr:BolA family protein [Roseisalinus antarcticus]SLN40213.1 transcriptional regulator BolA [Roseisalinus antarcticus]
MGLESEIHDRLEAAFAPRTLVVENESHRHAGHAGDDGSGESHWKVTIEAEAFAGMSRIARHRAVHGALGPGIMGRIHALSLDLS